MLKFARVFAALLFVSMTPAAQAIDAYQKIEQQRPGNLDLSTTVQSSGGYFSATYQLDGACPPMNKIHRWVISLRDRSGNPMSGVELVVVADMPEHLHGMTTRPTVSELSTAGTYEAKGMNFHMPGWWKVTLDASRGGGRDLGYFNILVGEGYCHSESH